MTQPHIELAGIVKVYSGTRVLDVSLEIGIGSVHAVVGANGAGKSTLGKIVAGAIRPDEGQLIVNGKPVHYADPRDARRDGIALIAQELALVPHLTVMENIFLGIEPRSAGVVSKRRMAQRYGELSEQWGFRLERDAAVRRLRLADQQKVEILRAVAFGAKAIVMDEPTSSLTHLEVQTLHEMVRELRRRGTTIIYVSHFLDEVLDLTDNVTVLRNGQVVRTAPASAETEASLVQAMFGAAVAAEQFEKQPPVDPPVVLRAKGLKRDGVLRDVSLEIHQGEIVGLAGLVGSGRSALVRAIFGADAVDSGTIAVDGVEHRIRSPRDALRAGIALVPESRKQDGLFLELTSAANTTVARVRTVASRAGVLSQATEVGQAEPLLRGLSVEPSSGRARVAVLSGGNQQKVLFARWLFLKPRVLLLDEPTRGVDVDARAAIHRLINDLAREGVAILLISSEFEEILGLAHRVLVMRRGAITREYGADPPIEDVMEAAFGLDSTEGSTA
jgi:simple sugar transport system ATP-binding protein/ribose transport system ATP-binding protein